MPARVGVSAFEIPGYMVPDAMPSTPETQQTQTAKPYKIPPVVWMLAFLFFGYVGIRLILED